jgi:hypothetical protein
MSPSTERPWPAAKTIGIVAVGTVAALLLIHVAWFSGGETPRVSGTTAVVAGLTKEPSKEPAQSFDYDEAPSDNTKTSARRAAPPQPTTHLLSSPAKDLTKFASRNRHSLPPFSERTSLKFSVFRREVCTHTPAAAPTTGVAAVNLRQYRQVPCPRANATDEVRPAPPRSTEYFEQQPDWVLKQYAGYATKCGEKKGVMWKKLKPHQHDGVANAMFDAAFAGLMTKDRKSVAVLDWASGCGADTAAYRRLAWERKLDFHSIGVDIVDAAVNWARDHAAELFADGDAQRAAAAQDTRNTFRYCAADGSDLSWVPSRSVDAILSLSGLTHVPTPYLCRTVAHYARVLKPRSRAVACYLHLPQAVDVLGNCTVDCAANGVQGSFVMSRFKMNDFFGKEWPEWYRKIHSDCIVWERLG